MMNFINSIGQRKVSKILILLATLISLVSFVVMPTQHGLIHPLTLLGLALVSAPVAILSRAAHKSKDYRLFCIISQCTVIALNTLLYFMKIPEYFFWITLGEIITTILFLVFFVKKPEKKPVREKKENAQSGEK